MLDRKVCERADLKFLDEHHGSFTGYASTFGNRDRAGEIVTKGAFRNLEAFTRDGFIAVGHDWGALPVATVTKAYEDDLGLVVEAAFHSTRAAQDARTTVRERLERGKFVGLSIGYRVLPDGAEETDEGTLLRALELFETSIVTVPCNPIAQVAGAKDHAEPDAPPAGMSLADHADAVLTAAEGWTRLALALTAREQEITELRAKQGRVLSAANVERVARLRDLSREMADECDTLLRMAEPKAAADHRSLYAEYLATAARLAGVAV